EFPSPPAAPVLKTSPQLHSQPDSLCQPFATPEIIILAHSRASPSEEGTRFVELGTFNWVNGESRTILTNVPLKKVGHIRLHFFSRNPTEICPSRGPPRLSVLQPGVTSGCRLRIGAFHRSLPCSIQVSGLSTCSCVQASRLGSAKRPQTCPRLRF